MKRRAHGWTWVQAILACPWAWKEGFAGNIEMRGMREPMRVFQALGRYLAKGTFTPAEKKLMRELNRQYRIWCARNDIEPMAFPKSMEK